MIIRNWQELKIDRWRILTFLILDESNLCLPPLYQMIHTRFFHKGNFNHKGPLFLFLGTDRKPRQKYHRHEHVWSANQSTVSTNLFLDQSQVDQLEGWAVWMSCRSVDFTLFLFIKAQYFSFPSLVSHFYSSPRRSFLSSWGHKRVCWDLSTKQKYFSWRKRGALKTQATKIQNYCVFHNK